MEGTPLLCARAGTGDVPEDRLTCAYSPAAVLLTLLSTMGALTVGCDAPFGAVQAAGSR